jgi:hypothetical protein
MNPGRFEETLTELRELAQRDGDLVVAEEAALQIIRVRKDRDLAVENEQSRIREQTLQLLYEQGGPEARSYLDNLNTPFAEEMQPQVRNLKRRIRIWEKQEKQQREAEKRAAQESLDALTRELVPLILQREWSQALDALKAASRDPMYYPVSEELASLRREVKDLRDVSGRVLESFKSLLGTKVVLELPSRWIELQLTDVSEEGLRGVRNVPLGTVEEDIAFSQLSSAEVVRRLEALDGTAAQITIGLIAHREGKKTACLNALDEAGTPLAEIIMQELYPLPTLDSF